MARAPEPPDRPRDPQQEVDADPESVARAIVLRQLTMAARSRHQLEQALSRRDVPPDVAARVLDRMTEVGLVDDASYARDYVEQRRAVRASSRRALVHELRGKGVADELIDDAVAGIDADDERSTALGLARRKRAALSSLDEAAVRRRLVGLLARRGYPAGLAYSVVAEVLGSQDDVLVSDPD